MKRGFTLLELIVVVIILGVLATLGFVQYTKVIEKGRKAEARTNLGTLRSLEVVRFQETSVYTTLANLSTGLPDGACNANYYFSYACVAATGTCTATRCSPVASGKNPGVPAADIYTISLDVNGGFSGTGDWQ